MDSTLVVVLAGAVAAGFVQGLSGFAFGLVATSIWAWWLMFVLSCLSIAPGAGPCGMPLGCKVI
jgi:hypothetical protein